MTSGIVVEKMNQSELYTYVAGIVEGLAHARVDGAKPASGERSCVYRWFYETEGTFDRIFVTMGHFKDRMPGAVVAAMAEKRCPT